MSLYFRLESATLSGYYTKGLQEVTVAGKRAFLDRNEEEKVCNAEVVHRSTPSATEMLEIDIELDLSPDELCTLATNLATIAEKYLPEA